MKTHQIIIINHSAINKQFYSLNSCGYSSLVNCSRGTVLPEWICNLTDSGEWLHTGSKRSTQATEQTETRYTNGNSGMEKQNTFSSLEKISRCILIILTFIILSRNCLHTLSGINTYLTVYGNTQDDFFFLF